MKTYQQLVRQKKFRLGLCRACKEPVADDDPVFCKKHRRQAIEAKRASRARKKQ